jgi:siroheme synthase (precorrin-2 oxidase/ferrochelatase)
VSGDFMPSEGMITRPHDAPWERLVRGQRVTITHGDRSSAAMRVTDVIAHHDGGETYVLRDAAITDEELEAEVVAFAEAMAWPVFVQDVPSEAHPMHQVNPAP